MQPWLNRTDFDTWIGDIPVSFDVERLQPALTEVLDTWLYPMWGTPTFGTYKTLFTDYGVTLQDITTPITNTTLPYTEQNRLDSLKIRQFLTYATWSSYLLRYGLQPTATGMVLKLNQDSDPMTDRQRSDLHRHYRGLAETLAPQIAGLRGVESCTTATTYNPAPRIRKAAPRSPSRLGN